MDPKPTNPTPDRPLTPERKRQADLQLDVDALVACAIVAPELNDRGRAMLEASAQRLRDALQAQPAPPADRPSAREGLLKKLELYRDRVFHEHEAAVMTLVEDGSHVPDIQRMLNEAIAALRAEPPAPASKVGCEDDAGLLHVHPESETCEVCAPASATEQALRELSRLVTDHTTTSARPGMKQWLKGLGLWRSPDGRGQGDTVSMTKSRYLKEELAVLHLIQPHMSPDIRGVVSQAVLRDVAIKSYRLGRRDECRAARADAGDREGGA